MEKMEHYWEPSEFVLVNLFCSALEKLLPMKQLIVIRT